MLNTSFFDPGGKAKPLKAPKKERKDLDDDDLAYREKLKAGVFTINFMCNTHDSSK